MKRIILYSYNCQFKCGYLPLVNINKITSYKMIIITLPAIILQIVSFLETQYIPLLLTKLYVCIPSFSIIFENRVH